MIGKIFPSFLPYWDRNNNVTSFKSRPVLIIAEPTGMDTDYTVLPVSTVSRKEFLNDTYDIGVCMCDYPKIKIKKDSYIRTHKQTLVSRPDIDFGNCMGNLKVDYPETFRLILEKLCEFEADIIKTAKLYD